MNPVIDLYLQLCQQRTILAHARNTLESGDVKRTLAFMQSKIRELDQVIIESKKLLPEKEAA